MERDFDRDLDRRLHLHADPVEFRIGSSLLALGRSRASCEDSALQRLFSHLDRKSSQEVVATDCEIPMVAPAAPAGPTDRLRFASLLIANLPVAGRR